jgi:hypothetical protein
VATDSGSGPLKPLTLHYATTEDLSRASYFFASGYQFTRSVIGAAALPGSVLMRTSHETVLPSVYQMRQAFAAGRTMASFAAH